MQKLYYVKKQYYNKDKKAQIYKKIIGERDPSGFRTDDKYKPVAPSELWCYTKQLSQDQKYAAAAYGEQEDRLFIFNYRNDVKLYDYIRYKNDWYSVKRVDTTEDYNTELFIYAALLDRTHPSDDEIVPYDYDPDASDDTEDTESGTGSGSGNTIIGYDEDGFPIYG